MSIVTHAEPSQGPAPRLLDDETAAHVLEELISLEAVSEKEIKRILAPGTRGLSYREIAITLSMSTVLKLPAPFELPPVYALARRLIDIGRERDSDDITGAVTCLLAEALCVGVDLTREERESLLLSALAAVWPTDAGPIDDVLDAIDQHVVGVGQRATVQA